MKSKSRGTFFFLDKVQQCSRGNVAGMSTTERRSASNYRDISSRENKRAKKIESPKPQSFFVSIRSVVTAINVLRDVLSIFLTRKYFQSFRNQSATELKTSKTRKATKLVQETFPFN